MPVRILPWVFVLMAALGVAACAQEALEAPRGGGPPRRPAIGVLHSEPTLQAGGWRAAWNLDGAEASLRRLGLKVHRLAPEELEAGLWKGDLLVLADVRLMSPATVQAVHRHVASGGRILATGQTSYRDEANRPWPSPGFALSDCFGVDFHRWSGVDFEAGLVLEETLGGGRMLLGRPEAMLVRVRPQARVLARFADAEGSPAILQTPAGIYAGFSLFAPENSDSAEVTGLLGQLLERLLPGWKPSGPPRSGARVRPEMPFQEESETPESVQVSVGLSALTGEALVAATEGLSWGAGSAREVRIRAIRTVGRPPAIALFDRQGRLLTRSEAPICLKGSPWLELVRMNPNGTYRWSAWRGALCLEPGSDSVRVSNRLPLESYLRGVVPNEMPAWFPPQALRAMAVVARSFTLAHLGRHRAQGHDLCATVHCHVYEGLASENPVVGEAIAQTRGRILLDQGSPLAATYHAVCGGVGEAPEAVWPGGTRVEALPGGPDTREPLPVGGSLADEAVLRRFLDEPPPAWCEGASRFRWEETWSLEDLEPKVAQALPRLLGEQAPDLGRLRSLKVLERTPHGRVATLLIQGERASVRVHGDSIRWLFSGGRIGAGGLNSTLFYLEERAGGIRFRGGGWGHGVGLCQEGAGGRARGGQGYREILQHYYPGAQVSEIGEILLPALQGGAPVRRTGRGEVEVSRP